MTLLRHTTKRWPTVSAIVLTAVALAVGCGRGAQPAARASAGAFGADLDFLQQHTKIVLLADSARAAQVVVAPEYQGRVMTSTTGGDPAPSFGWIGRAAIASGKRQPHMNVFGGEDRFWLGPEGGQFALFFTPGDPFDLDHWQTPEPIDWGAWDVVNQAPTANADSYSVLRCCAFIFAFSAIFGVIDIHLFQYVPDVPTPPRNDVPLMKMLAPNQANSQS